MTFTITNGITSKESFPFCVTFIRKLSNGTCFCLLLRILCKCDIAFSLNRFIAHTATVLFTWCFATRVCNVPHILHVSLISFEVRASSTFFSSSADLASSITSCYWETIIHNSMVRGREEPLAQLWSRDVQFLLPLVTHHLFISENLLENFTHLLEHFRTIYSHSKVLLCIHTYIWFYNIYINFRGKVPSC